ncbi:Krueppel-like factor 3 [Hypsizygus marmoreus]|uniref:Krueppel-like factor 3 n=1 Tax=Hypsizygus marmoreus TaxID=39966 RepID=A0A369JXZ6_HYPMA|nr:Krueppel-like factor 3 [Hypsizygus marmoreus]
MDAFRSPPFRDLSDIMWYDPESSGAQFEKREAPSTKSSSSSSPFQEDQIGEPGYQITSHSGFTFDLGVDLVSGPELHQPPPPLAEDLLVKNFLDACKAVGEDWRLADVALVHALRRSQDLGSRVFTPPLTTVDAVSTSEAPVTTSGALMYDFDHGRHAEEIALANEISAGQQDSWVGAEPLNLNTPSAEDVEFNATRVVVSNTEIYPRDSYSVARNVYSQSTQMSFDAATRRTSKEFEEDQPARPRAPTLTRPSAHRLAAMYSLSARTQYPNAIQNMVPAPESSSSAIRRQSSQLESELSFASIGTVQPYYGMQLPTINGQFHQDAILHVPVSASVATQSAVTEEHSTLQMNPYIMNHVAAAAPRASSSTKRKRVPKVAGNTGEQDFMCIWPECTQTTLNRNVGEDDTDYNGRIRAHLKDHTKVVRPEEDKKFPCSWGQCTDRLADKKGLHRHVESHASLRVRCPDCDRLLSRDDAMKLHQAKGCKKRKGGEEERPDKKIRYSE